ncbi:MAG TPA: xylose isomerase, partial [Ruminococcaceae bacterium]|nr:xylose isomerase [Oscillospiraceae bacterium]
MKLGVFTCVVNNMNLKDALKYFKSLGIEMVEIGCGGYPGKAHCDPEVLLHDEKKLEEFKA